MASVGNMNNYGHEVTNDKEKKIHCSKKASGEYKFKIRFW